MRRQTLIDFYKFALPRTNFPNLYEHSIRMSSLFGSTYVCEALFSKMKCAKSKYSCRLTDTNLENTLRISNCNIHPKLNILISENMEQYHPSH